MAQITSGARAVLSSATVYDTFQWLMGGRVGRSDFAGTMVRAAAGTRILDIGCGTGELLAYLPEGVHYHGWDISEEYVAAARTRFGARGAFHAGVLTEAVVTDAPPYDVVIASGVLHHLDDAQVRDLARLARLAVRRGGRFVSIDPVYASGQHPLARFLIARDRGQHLRTADQYLALVRPAFDDATGWVRHRRWVPYTHWMMEATGRPVSADGKR
ncbi:MAG TPA: class I SAM-dependent methyltransferase [Vicinamibacterales bacterium]|nr:class I SAM-dependent methyltransferase [Vicinamibacterales bacterium]